MAVLYMNENSTMWTHVSTDSMCTGILHRQHNAGNKSKMELHSPFREKKKAHKGKKIKKIWPMQKTRGKAQDE